MAVALPALALSACSDFVILRPTPTPVASIQSLPPIGFNHVYGNSPLAAADGFAFEHELFAQQMFWEVGVRADPQAAGFIDRSDPRAVAAARPRITALLIALATEKRHTIGAMLAFPQDTDQERYVTAVLQHFRQIGYVNVTKATVLMYFTEQDEHAVLTWTSAAGYRFKVLDNNLRGSAFRTGPAQTPPPLPG